MNENQDFSPQSAWSEFVEADKRYHSARMRAVSALKNAPDIASAIMRETFRTPGGEWAAALRLLPLLDDVVRQTTFPVLMDLAAHETKHIFGARSVIMSIDRSWLDVHLPQEVDRILSATPDYDAYRRLAELLELLHSPFLKTLLERAKLSNNSDIREVAEDFEGK